jgi:hypothetical protein
MLACAGEDASPDAGEACRRAITTLGLVAVVGPVVVLVGVWLAARGRVARAASLVTCRAHGEARLHLGSLSRRQHPHLD